MWNGGPTRPRRPIPKDAYASRRLLKRKYGPIHRLKTSTKLSSIAFLCRRPSQVKQRKPDSSTNAARVCREFLNRRFPPLSTKHGYPIRQARKPIHRHYNPRTNRRQTERVRVRFLQVTSTQFIRELLCKRLQASQADEVQTRTNFLQASWSK